jgi:hypothetical protein
MKPKLIACALVLAAPVFAQDPNQAKLDKKLAKDFVKTIEWVQDYDVAKKSAATGEKLILAYFTRSYAP